HRFAHFPVQVVELRGVIPWVAGAIVPVIHITRVAGPAITTAKDDGSVGFVVVVIFYLDFYTAIGRQIGSFEAIHRKWRLGDRDKPIRVLNHPARIDAHVVGDHVAAQADAAM